MLIKMLLANLNQKMIQRREKIFPLLNLFHEGHDDTIDLSIWIC